MDQNINEVLRTIDFYCELLENFEVFKDMDINFLKKAFQASIFIEKAIKRIEEEKKEPEFESHLKSWMSNKKKIITYKCDNLKTACDKLLEFSFKQQNISNEIIDELIKMYIQQCGHLRLETLINHILMNSMQANAIIQTLKNLEFSKSDIEDELLIASWQHSIKIGKIKIIMDCLINMFNKECISRLIELAYKSETNSCVNNLILNFLAKKLEDNNVLLYSELKDTKRKVLIKLLVDNCKFQISFVDATFYIGRNMEPNDEEDWITDTGFSYHDLRNVIQVLLDGPEQLYKLIIDRIKLAKELDAVWENIERDCIL